MKNNFNKTFKLNSRLLENKQLQKRNKTILLLFNYVVKENQFIKNCNQILHLEQSTITTACFSM